MDREVLHADVEHSAAIHVPGQLNGVFIYDLQHAALVLLDVLRVGGLAEVNVLELPQFGVESFLNKFLHNDGGIRVAHQLLDH